MIQHRFFWSAILALFSTAGCAFAQTAGAAGVDTDSVLHPAVSTIAPRIAPVIYNTDDLAQWIVPVEPGPTRASDYFLEERILRPQPDLSRKATIIFTQQDPDAASPTPQHSRAVRLILQRG